MLQPHGKLVAAGLFVSGASFVFALARYLAADLELSVFADQVTVRTGTPLTYTLTVQNFGPDTAYGVVLSEPVPPGTVFMSATPSQGSCVTPHIGAGGVIVCNLGAVFASANAPVTLKVKVAARGGRILTNTATVSSSGEDPNLQNNTAAVLTRVFGSRK